MTHERKRDILAALLFLAVGLLTLLVLIPQGVVVPSSVTKPALSPDFWPRIISIGAIASSVFLLVENTLLKQPSAIPEDEMESATQYDMSALPATIRTLFLIIALFAFYSSLTTLGVVVPSIVLISAMMVFFGERKYWLIGVLSLGMPILLYLFFRYVASVPIPLGIFGG